MGTGTSWKGERANTKGKMSVVRWNISLTLVTGGLKFRIYSHLVKGFGSKMLDTIAFLMPVCSCGSREPEKCR